MNLQSLRFVSLFLFFSAPAFGQTGFNLNAYRLFLQNNQNMTTQQLLQNHNAGTFTASLNIPLQNALYLDTIQAKYQLTAYERTLLQKHGFMVTQRLSTTTFGAALLDIYHKDLPVFISADAVLHAWHWSYDRILKDIEENGLIPKLQTVLGAMRGKMPDIHTQYASTPAMAQNLRDLDIYLTVGLRLLNGTAQPYYQENASAIENIITKINGETLASLEIFSSNCRTYDFSQMKPRGHYTETEELKKYFGTMMWFGRTEMYLLRPRGTDPFCPPQSDADIKRQIIDAVLVKELLAMSGSAASYYEIESIIRFFVGEQDNVTYSDLNFLCGQLQITNASQLLDTIKVKVFQDSLKQQPFAYQKILSQIMGSNPMSPDSIIPAAAFMLFGQRFVIDSYVTGSVVYDRILYNGLKVKRMLPSTLDVLFALGNDAAGQLLQPELNQYHYASNLAALRYLVDSYDESFWNATNFNLWLNAIRALQPPAVRDSLPAFMRTAAYWQKNINSQLMSWSELRHDNLLYAKQSYTGVPICSFPYGYVEPVPALYAALKKLAEVSYTRVSNLPIPSYQKQMILDYCSSVKYTMDTLAAIAGKEIGRQQLTGGETAFLKRTIFEDHPYCGPPTVYDGWYPNLYYDDYLGIDGLLSKDYVVADIHTAPADENGNIVGWVKHAGTGPINLGVFIGESFNNQNVAYIGPVGSYYQITTNNFLRLTDQEWTAAYLFNASRPSFVNLYLADTTGNSRGDGVNLITSLEKENHPTLPENYLTAANYPNPFNAGTVILFNIPLSAADREVSVTIYDITGMEVLRLLKEPLAAGAYAYRWDGTNAAGHAVPSGVYLYRVTAGAQMFNGKMTLMK